MRFSAYRVSSQLYYLRLRLYHPPPFFSDQCVSIPSVPHFLLHSACVLSRSSHRHSPSGFSRAHAVRVVQKDENALGPQRSKEKLYIDVKAKGSPSRLLSIRRSLTSAHCIPLPIGVSAQLRQGGKVSIHLDLPKSIPLFWALHLWFRVPFFLFFPNTSAFDSFSSGVPCFWWRDSTSLAISVGVYPLVRATVYRYDGLILFLPPFLSSALIC
ncbi:hypothetical protein EDC04DRAFT_494305 [Pisolithus marmoratus]|nr:hypothetical protein EDC04DRAFT_494305 [Pisolithus marmoratus]